MELHESLYALGRSQGRELFNDADSFRGALDDYLDEDSASTGDINLLVDAVRLGAFQGMMSMLDSGADADRAVSEAGSRLARDRGSADVGGAMWALAVLGYATGKVSDVQVRRYRTQHASAPTPPPPGPATVLPPPAPGSAPAPPPGPAPPPRRRPRRCGRARGAPRASPGSAPAPPATAYGAPPPASYGGYGHAAPRKKRKVWPLVLIGALVLVLVVVGGIFAVVQLSDDDGDENDDPTIERRPHHVRARGPRRVLRGAQRALPEPRGDGDVGHGQLRAAQAPVGADGEDRVHLPPGHAGADDVRLGRRAAGGPPAAPQQRRGHDRLRRRVRRLLPVRPDHRRAGEHRTTDPLLGQPGGRAVGRAHRAVPASRPTSSTPPSWRCRRRSRPPDGPTDIAVQDFNSLFKHHQLPRGSPPRSTARPRRASAGGPGGAPGSASSRRSTTCGSYRSNAKTLAEQDGDLVVDYWYNDDNSNGSRTRTSPSRARSSVTSRSRTAAPTSASSTSTTWTAAATCRCTTRARPTPRSCTT